MKRHQQKKQYKICTNKNPFIGIRYLIAITVFLFFCHNSIGQSTTSSSFIDENYINKADADVYNYDIHVIDNDNTGLSWGGSGYTRALVFGSRNNSNLTYLFSKATVGNIGLVANGKVGLNVASDGIAAFPSGVFVGNRESGIVNYSTGGGILNLFNGGTYTNAGTATALRLIQNGVAGTKYNGTADFNIGTYGTALSAQSQLDIRLGNGNTHTPDVTVMSLLGNGHVGIGTKTPKSGSRLTVEDNTGNTESSIAIGSSSGSWDWSGIKFYQPSGGELRVIYKYVDGEHRVGFTDGANNWLAYSNYNSNSFIVPYGNIGIGTTNPEVKLHVSNGHIASISSGSRSSASGPITLSGGVYPTIESVLRITNTNDNTSSQYVGRFLMKTYGSSNPFLNIETVQDNVPIVMEVGDKPIMQMFQNQVLIGPNLPFPSSNAVIPYSGLNYTLGVRGVIVAEGVKCVALSKWADYVFKEDFNLMPLSEVEAYTQKNKHLPEVPSEAELKEKGVDVVEMLKIQMQKIEELTLYTIELEKKSKQQQEQIEKLIQAQARNNK